MKRVPSKQCNSRINHERDPRAFSRLALLLFCGLVLTGGFVFAAQQHFAAVQFGYQSERLRVERDRLLQEQQHLILQKEQAFAPARLESDARSLGLRPVAASQLEAQKSVKGRLPIAPALLNPGATFRR
ncbi:MAG TPA: cell division protein FtsL [Pyrinomonadaceae bacterium]|nr:cell division protein FtsL [Pyrinomonadaceae bacterium]